MKTLAPATFAAFAAGPALAHADRAVHMHRTDVAVWLVTVLCTRLAATVFLRR